MRKAKAVLLRCRRHWNRRGQATVEYVLMLGSILVVFSAFLTAFHQDIIRWLFAFIGLLLPTK